MDDLCRAILLALWNRHAGDVSGAASEYSTGLALESEVSGEVFQVATGAETSINEHNRVGCAGARGGGAGCRGAARAAQAGGYSEELLWYPQSRADAGLAARGGSVQGVTGDMEMVQFQMTQMARIYRHVPVLW